MMPTTESVQRPAYWTQACDHLVKRDRILRKLIPAYEFERIQPHDSPFETLIRLVVGQQISLSRGRRLWAELRRACGDDIQPACVGALAESELRALGLSLRKAQYLRDAAAYFSAVQRMDPAYWHALDDAAVAARLCEIRGVGRWTADMFLIFFLGRPDVLPLDDRSLLKAISQHYFSGEPVSRFEAREVAQAWAPWCTVASWYLWRSQGAAAVEY